MPTRAAHDLEDLLYVSERNVLMKQVAHGVHEDRLRLLPPKWKLKHVWLQREFEAIPIVRLAHRLETFGHAFGIAMLAARANLGATGDRVPGRFCPLDAGALCHHCTPFVSR